MRKRILKCPLSPPFICIWAGFLYIVLERRKISKDDWGTRISVEEFITQHINQKHLCISKFILCFLEMHSDWKWLKKQDLCRNLVTVHGLILEQVACTNMNHLTESFSHVHNQGNNPRTAILLWKSVMAVFYKLICIYLNSVFHLYLKFDCQFRLHHNFSDSFIDFPSPCIFRMNFFSFYIKLFLSGCIAQQLCLKIQSNFSNPE